MAVQTGVESDEIPKISDPLVTDYVSGMRAAGGVGAEFYTRISDLPVRALEEDSVDLITQIATSLKTGLDGKLVTGTSGATGNLAIWDVNGDLIDSGVSSDTQPIFTKTHVAAGAILTAECYGGVHSIESAGNYTLPAVAVGHSLTVVTIGNIAVSLEPNGVEVIMLNGVALAGGNKIANTATTGDIAVLTYKGTGVWLAVTNDWLDGGT